MQSRSSKGNLSKPNYGLRKRKYKGTAKDEETLECSDKATQVVSDLENIENNFQIADGNNPIIQFKYDLKKVLTDSNHNLEKWLDLDSLPYCLMNLNKCMQNHAYKNNFSKYVISQELSVMLLLYIKNKEYLEACKYLQFCITVVCKIPNESTLIEFLKIIMDIHNSEDDRDLHIFILKMIEDCFITLFALYPSHIKYMRQYYKRLLTMPLQNCKHKDHENYESFNGIFFYCINRLESELLAINISQRSEVNNVKTLNNNESDSIALSFAFNESELFDHYDDLSREEKLSRLYLLLQIIVKIFEDDLAFRILVKKSECATVSRLLGIIAHVLHLMSNNRKNLFLSIGMQLNILAIEIFTSIQAEEPSYIIHILSMLRPCFLKNLVANKILSMIHSILNNGLYSCNMTYADIFEKKLWTLFSATHATHNKYVLDISADTDTLHVNCSSYLAILFQAFSSFVDMYEIKCINLQVVKIIQNILENNKSNMTCEMYQSFEKDLFKKYYQCHIDSSRYSESNNYLLKRMHDFDYVMKIKKNMHIESLVHNHSYLPAISWITGRSYYKKCILYMNVIDLIEKLKVEVNGNVPDITMDYIFNFKL
ncbi:uncharacterized protein LOC113378046 isoform X2 [Ctenocephalides felis]|uniref:uncharacterized protein LOC113378046 isoform X2 n=1 Tax=Ctenocephalides felis TaxID=7515 RepID=UPI000E6E5301|nr:uncharacterized protein LOC113378046 isoform X2 [Ctenocephalides felis]